MHEAVKRTRKESLKRCLKLWEKMLEIYREVRFPRIKSLKQIAYREFNWKADVNDCPACTYRDTHPSRYFCYETCIIDWDSPGNCNSLGHPYRMVCKDCSEKNIQKVIDLIRKSLEEGR